MPRCQQYLLSTARRWLSEEDGPTATEYAVMLALIVVLVITTVMSIGTKMSQVFTRVDTALNPNP